MITSLDNIKIYKADGLFPGTQVTEGGIRFTCAFKVKDSLVLNIYDLNSKKLLEVNMLDYRVSGNVYSVYLELKDFRDFLYDYSLDGECVKDPVGKNVTNTRNYGEQAGENDIDKNLIYTSDFDWCNDTMPHHEFSDIISYSMHVRGFTRHSSSKVKAKGTFAGIVEKIPYLQELFINQVELMPAYDFYEFDSEKEHLVKGHPKYQSDQTINEAGELVKNSDKVKLNYWGYKAANYYYPKPAYSYSKDFINEFKTMVRELHKASIEVVMQFYFPKNFNKNDILDILRFWKVEYHIDGFHVMGENLPKNLIVSDNILSDAKLYFDYISMDELSDTDVVNEYIADISKGFLTDARRFLKSDDDSLYAFVRAQRYNPSDIHKINYLTCYEGFTLNDLVSYDYKHNEANGEDNRDGTNYNFSWNCGVEGVSRKKSVQELRLRQMKNAFALLLLSQATPMIFMGDELMNTQKGNNNPYCQDNDITWINWNMTKQNTELFEFVKSLIAVRKKYKILHLKDELKMIDYKSVGYPDISYHQDMAWKSRTDSFMKHIGIMLSGDYFDGEDSIYIAYNMHWENHLFGLPKLSKKFEWEYVIDTSGDGSEAEIKEELGNNTYSVCVNKRSVLVLKSKAL